MRSIGPLLLLLSMTSGVLANPIYRWVDDQGVTNYTNEPSQIPSKYRAQITTGEQISYIAPEPSNAPRSESAPAIQQASQASYDILTPDERNVAEQWRAAFREAHARIAQFEYAINSDKRLLESAGLIGTDGITRYYGTYGRWFYDTRYLQVQQRVHQNEAELKRAREALEDLDRAASREAVPREWRQP